MTTYIGTNGADSITSSADLIYARKGDDTVLAINTAGATVNGGDGNDLLIYSPSLFGHGWLNGGDGADTLVTSGYNYVTLVGGAGADSLVGGLGGGALLEGGRGADTLDGGGENSTASYAHAAGPVKVDMLDASQNTGEAAGDVYRNIENLIGSAFNDTLAGRFGGYLEGGAGADRLIGEVFSGVASYEHAQAGVRASLLDASGNTGDAAGDVYVNILGLVGSAFADSLRGDDRANIIQGGAGDDLLQGRGGNDRLDGGDGNDRLDGGQGDDSLDGGAGDDSLSGGDGNDLLAGGLGHDTLSGGNGDDHFLSQNGTGHYDGGAGSDTVDYSGDTLTPLRADLGHPATNTGGAHGDTYVSIENLVGSNFADTLVGDAAANQLAGGAGNDLLIGGDGNDLLLGGLGDDTLQGGSGDDTLQGGAGQEADKDVLTGGAGHDVFYVLFRYPPDNHFHTTISDFQDGVDKLQLVQVFPDNNPDGSASFQPVPFSDLVISQVGDNVEIVDKGDPSPDFRYPGASIVLLHQSVANITSADFI